MHGPLKSKQRRSHKLFPMISDEINRAVAGEILRNTELKVNVREPQLRIQIEVHQEDTYIMTGRIAGQAVIRSVSAGRRWSCCPVELIPRSHPI